MNQRLKLLSEQADAYADAMDYVGKNYIGLRDNYFAELIVKETMQVVANNLPQNTYIDVAHAVIEHYTE